MGKYDNFSRHLFVLKRAPEEDLTNEFIISGIIDKFFVQFELGWKVLKELLAYEGNPIATTGSPRSIIKAAYQFYNFIEEEIWLNMMKDRNNMTHIYDEKQARDLADPIIAEYIPAFIKMDQAIKRQYGITP